MTLSPEHRERVRQIIGHLRCPKDFECYLQDFENICQGILRANGELLECQDPSNSACLFRLPVAKTGYCTCPLRKYIARHFHK